MIIASEFDEEKTTELIHPSFRAVYLGEKHSVHIFSVGEVACITGARLS